MHIRSLALVVALAALPVSLAAVPVAPDEIAGATVVLESGELLTGDFTVRKREGKKIQVRQGKGRYLAADLVLGADGDFYFPEQPGPAELDPLRVVVAHRAAAGEERADVFCDLRARLAAPESELALALLADALAADAEHERATAALGALPEAPRVRLARALLEIDAAHPAVAALVRDALPPPLDARAAEALAGWLVFLERQGELGVTLLTDPAAARGATPELAEDLATLARLRGTPVWGRPDLVGYRTRRVLLVTPLARPELVLRCLERAETLSSFLEELFAPLEPRRPSRYPLSVLLFESEAEYEDKLGRVAERKSHTTHATEAGRFYDVDATSRLYEPYGGTGEDRLLATLTHELVHHWISACCRGVTNEELDAATTRWRSSSLGGDARAGHWIVEGFAAYVEHELDAARDAGPDAERVDLRAPQMRAFEVLAHAPEDALVPWERLFTLSHLEAKDLGFAADVEVEAGARTWRLSARSSYAVQSAAVARYLAADVEEGSRAALLAAIVAYEKGWPLGVEEAFGVPAGELGARVVAFAKRR